MVSSIVNDQTVSIWAMSETLTGTTTPGQSDPGSYANERVLHILQSSRNEASPSDAV